MIGKIRFLLFFLVLGIFISNVYSQTSTTAQLRQKADAVYNEYMVLISKYGFYDSRAIEKLEEYKKIKKQLEQLQNKNFNNSNVERLSIEKKADQEKFLSHLIHNMKLSYYKTRALNLSRKIDRAIQEGKDTRNLEEKLAKIYNKIYQLEGTNSSTTTNNNLPPTSSNPPSNTNNNTSNTTNTDSSVPPININNGKTTKNKLVDYNRIKKMDFYLQKSPQILDKYDAELILLQFLNFKKFSSRSALIADFQRANGLSVTGQLDLETKKAILYNLKQIKEAEERWGSANELSKDTLPYNTILQNASQNLTSFPSGIKTLSGDSLRREDLLDALIWAESSYIHRKKSGFTVSKYSQGNCGAIGFTQLMPFTAKSLGVNPYDPEENVKGGAKYLNSNFKKFSSLPYNKLDILSKSIAAYNCGPNRSAFRNYSWDQIVAYRKIPRESIIYAIKIKSKLQLPLSQTEIRYMCNNGYRNTLIRNGYSDILRRHGYL